MKKVADMGNATDDLAVIHAGDADAAADALGQLLDALTASTGEVPQADAACRAWEQYGVVRDSREGTREEVLAALRDSAVEDIDLQREKGKAEITFRLYSDGAVVRGDIEVLPQGETKAHRRRRWLAMRSCDGKFRLWTVGLSGAPYIHREEAEARRAEAASGTAEEHFKVLVSTRDFPDLCELDPPRAQEFLLLVLNDFSCEQVFHLAAVMALEYLPRGLANEALRTMRNHPDLEVRRTAVDALWRAEPRQTAPAICHLVHEFGWEAVDYFLGLSGAAHLLPHIATQEEIDIDVFQAAVAHLEENHAYDLTLPGLLTLYERGDEELRDWCVWKFAFLGDYRLEPLLIAELDRADADHRLEIIAGLARIPQISAISALVALLDDPEEKVRLAVLNALCATLGSDPAVFSAVLHTALHDKQGSVRACAWGTLRRYASELAHYACEGGAGLGGMDADMGVLAEAPQRLHHGHFCLPFGDTLPSPDEALQALRGSTGDGLRNAMLRSLLYLGDAVVEPLRALLDSPDETTQLFAIRTAGDLNLRALVADLRERTGLLNRYTKAVRAAARTAVQQLTEQPASPAGAARAKTPVQWIPMLDAVMEKCRAHLTAMPLFQQPLYDSGGVPTPWQMLFAGGDLHNVNVNLGRPFRASAQGTLDEVLRLLRATTIHQWNMGLLAFRATPKEPAIADYRTLGGYPLTVLDFQMHGQIFRAAMLCRLTDDDYVIMVMGEGGEEGSVWDSSGWNSGVAA